MELVAVPIDKPEEVGLLPGQTHFIKTVEDLHQLLAASSPHLRSGRRS